MQERKSIFDYIYEVFAIFGFTMIFMVIFAKVFGDDAKTISSLFQLGNEGISVDIMLQFVGFSVINVALQYIYFTDRIIKDLSIVIRTVLMVVSILISSAFFIVIFEWFPINKWETWLIFIVCFIICFVASVVLSTVKNDFENKKLAEGLSKLKELDSIDED